MSNAKHTPGPWTSSKQGMNPSDYDLEVRTENSEYLIATVHMQLGSAEANARLIAAAPELLAALENLVEQIQQAGVAADYRLDAVLKALDKATGEDRE